MDYRKKKINIIVSKYVARKHIILVDNKADFVIELNKDKHDNK